MGSLFGAARTGWRTILVALIVLALSHLAGAQASVVGTFHLPDGKPAAGATWRLHGWAANSQREQLYGRPEDWTDLSGTLDQGGQLKLTFEPPQAYQFILRVQARGAAEAKWRFGEFAANRQLALGTIKLRTACILEGALVDAEGEPILGQRWDITGHEASPPGMGQQERWTLHTKVDQATGTFRFEGLPPATFKLQARGPLSSSVKGPTVTLAPGEITKAVIVCGSARFDDKLELIAQTTARSAWPFLSEELFMVSHGTQSSVAKRRWDYGENYLVEGLDPNLEYRVEVIDPNFRAQELSGVRSGRTVEVQLEGSVDLLVSVLDAEGRHLPEYSLQGEYLGQSFSPSDFVLHDGPATPEEHAFALIPTPTGLRVDSQGFKPQVIDLLDLAPSERRVLTITLTRSVPVHGTVSDAIGLACAPREIMALIPATVNDSRDTVVLTGGAVSSDSSHFRRVERQVLSDSLGRFTFFDLPDGTYIFATGQDSGELAQTPPVEIRGNLQVPEVQLQLEPEAMIVGKLLLPEGSRPEGLSVAWYQSKAPEWDIARRPGLDDKSHTPLSSSAGFSLGPFPKGQGTLHVLLPWHLRSKRSHSFSDKRRGLPLGSFDIARGGRNRIEPNMEGCPIAWFELELRSSGGNPVAANLVRVREGGGERRDLQVVKGAFKGWVEAGACRLEVHDPRGRWMHPIPEPLPFASMTSQVLTQELHFVRASLPLEQHGSDAPLAQRSLWVRPIDSKAKWWQPAGLATVGEEETVDLVLPVGHYEVALLHASAKIGETDPAPIEARAALGWTPEGPDVETLVLRRP